MCRHRHKSIHGHNMEVVDIYTYRVFIFPKNASFSQTKKAYHRKKETSFILLILSRLWNLGLWRFKAVGKSLNWFTESSCSCKAKHAASYGGICVYWYKKRICVVWFNLVSNKNKFPSKLYKLMYNDHLKKQYHI